MPLFHRVFVVTVVMWVALAPFWWWHSFQERFGVTMPWQFMVQPATLALVGLLALPFLWRGVRSMAWLTVGAVLVVAASQWVFPSAFRGGVLINGALLAAAAGLTLRTARP